MKRTHDKFEQGYLKKAEEKVSQKIRDDMGGKMCYANSILYERRG